MVCTLYSNDMMLTGLREAMRGRTAVSTSLPSGSRQWSRRECVRLRIEFITPVKLDLAPSDMCRQVWHIKHGCHKMGLRGTDVGSDTLN